MDVFVCECVCVYTHANLFLQKRHLTQYQYKHHSSTALLKRVSLLFSRQTSDQKYFVVVQLNSNRITLLEAPPIGVIGQCHVVSVIQLAEDVKPHLVDIDLKTGALYVAEIGAQQVQKFMPYTLDRKRASETPFKA